MRKVLVVGLMLSFLAVGLQAAPLLVETYQETQVSIPPEETDTLTVIEVSFSVDSSCYVLITTGGIVELVKMMLEVDGERLPPITKTIGSAAYWFTIPYTYLLDSGAHTIKLRMANYYNDQFPSTCTDGYLQALIFLPDAGGAVAERPAGDVEPTGAMKSVISKGPYVTVTGATELVDATGRVIENAIEEDRVSINTLPQGTYFARDGERTVVKIVKVQ